MGKWKLLALCSLLFLFMGTAAMAQTSKPAVNCPTNISSLPAIPYIGYGNHDLIRDCRKQWIKDNPVACQTYVQNLKVGLKYIDPATLTPECRSRYYYRTKELKRVEEDSHN